MCYLVRHTACLRLVDIMDMGIIGRMNKQAGITLIEVMICALITAVGLLGVFQLHAVAKITSYESDNYQSAYALLMDMEQRMRINNNVMDLYEGTDYGSGAYVPDLSCIDNQCDTLQLANWDKSQWDKSVLGTESEINGRYIGAPLNRTGCITVDDINVTIEITWSGKQETVDGSITDCGVAGPNRRSAKIETKILITDRLKADKT